MNKPKKVGFEIMKIANQIKRKADHNSEIKKIDNATCSNGWIIGYLHENADNDVFQKDIEENFSLARSTVSAVLSLMEEKELIKREPVSYDARLKKIVLTQKAKSLHKAVMSKTLELENVMLGGFSDKEEEMFFEFLERINENLRKTENKNVTKEIREVNL